DGAVQGGGAVADLDAQVGPAQGGVGGQRLAGLDGQFQVAGWAARHPGRRLGRRERQGEQTAAEQVSEHGDPSGTVGRTRALVHPIVAREGDRKKEALERNRRSGPLAAVKPAGKYKVATEFTEDTEGRQQSGGLSSRFPPCVLCGLCGYFSLLVDGAA